MNDTHHSDWGWASVLLRLAMATLFSVSSLNQLRDASGFVDYYETIFQGTWLPVAVVSLALTALPYVQLLLALWLLSGVGLRRAWICSGLLLIGLSFGLLLLDRYAIATDNFVYLFMVVGGLLSCRHDRFARPAAS